MLKEVEKILIDIFSNEMELPLTYGKDDDGNDVPCFVIGFNNSQLFRTPEIQMAIQSLGFKAVATNRTTDFEVEPPIETQRTSGQEVVQIDIMSKNSDARMRRHEIILALTSIYAEQAQEKYQFKISKIPQSVNNVSGAEGGSNLNRFSIVINCLTWYSKTKIITSYFDDFKLRVDNEDTIDETTGLIEISEGENNG